MSLEISVVRLHCGFFFYAIYGVANSLNRHSEYPGFLALRNLTRRERAIQPALSFFALVTDWQATPLLLVTEVSF